MKIYQEIILDHYKHPSNFGLETMYWVEGKAFNPLCGDEAVVRFSRIDGKVHMSQMVTGCAISQASASVLSEVMDGVSEDEVTGLADAFAAAVSGGSVDDSLHEDLEAFSGVVSYPARIKCALLPVQAVRSALTSHQEV
jgi:nitrogen fixation NifU-like protein